MYLYLSYSVSDEYLKAIIAQALQQAGHTVAATPHGITSMADHGAPLNQQVQSVVDADAVIVLLSPASVRDENLEVDFEVALREDIPIWPVVVSGQGLLEAYPLPRLLHPVGGAYCDLRVLPERVVEILSLFFIQMGSALNDNSLTELHWYDSAVAIQRDNPRAYHLRGTVYGARNEPEKAIADLSKAIDLNAYMPQAYANRAREYRKSQQYELALADCEAALRLDSKHRMAYIIRGNVEIKLEQYAEAVRDFDAALAIDPQDALSYANRGHAKCLLGQMDAALADCNRALAIDPQRWMARLFRGEVYQTQLEQKKRVEKSDPLLDLALADFNAVLAIGHDNAAYYGRARVRFWKGDVPGAVVDCQKTLALNPQHPAAERMRTFIEQHSQPHE